MAASSACVRENATPAPQREFEFGARRVQVTVPTGWEALDQGKQKRFRKGEFEIVLQNLGPRCAATAATPTHLAIWTNSSTGDWRRWVTTSGAM